MAKKTPAAKAAAGKKKTTGKLKPKNEFRYNFNKKHKQYVFGETENKYKSVGITHEEMTFGKKNMPLKKNPQTGKTEKAYVRNGIVSDKKKYYGEPIKNLKFSRDDMANVKSKIRNYKKRQKQKK